MSINEIINEVTMIFQNTTFRVYSSANTEYPSLTGPVFSLTGVDLVFLLFEIEKHFQIRIPAEFLVNGSFKSVDRIAKTVHSILNKK